MRFGESRLQGFDLLLGPGGACRPALALDADGGTAVGAGAALTLDVEQRGARFGQRRAARLGFGLGGEQRRLQVLGRGKGRDRLFGLLQLLLGDDDFLFGPRLRQLGREAQGMLAKTRESLTAIERAARDTESKLAAVSGARARAEEDLVVAKRAAGGSRAGDGGVRRGRGPGAGAAAAKTEAETRRTALAEARAAVATSSANAAPVPTAAPPSASSASAGRRAPPAPSSRSKP